MAITVDSCCCGCSLRTGSIIILSLKVVLLMSLIIIFILKGKVFFCCLSVFLLISIFSALYGTIAKKPAGLLFYIIVELFVIGVIAFLLIVALMALYFAPKFIEKMFHYYFEDLIGVRTEDTSKNAIKTERPDVDKSKTTEKFSTTTDSSFRNHLPSTQYVILFMCMMTFVLIVLLVYFLGVIYSYYILINDVTKFGSSKKSPKSHGRK